MQRPILASPAPTAEETMSRLLAAVSFAHDLSDLRMATLEALTEISRRLPAPAPEAAPAPAPVVEIVFTEAAIDAAFRALPADACGLIGTGEMERVLMAAFRAMAMPGAEG